jgi:transposase
MKRLSKEDLAQMNQGYFKSLDKQRLVEVPGNLHKLAVEQLEKLEQTSKNSSKPQSSDSSFAVGVEPLTTEQPTRESGSSETKASENKEEDTSNKSEALSKSSANKGFGKKTRSKASRG